MSLFGLASVALGLTLEDDDIDKIRAVLDAHGREGTGPDG